MILISIQGDIHIYEVLLLIKNRNIAFTLQSCQVLSIWSNFLNNLGTLPTVHFFCPVIQPALYNFISEQVFWKRRILSHIMKDLQLSLDVRMLYNYMCILLLSAT